MENKLSQITELFSKTRQQTLSLCENLEAEDMVIQPSKNVSPLIRGLTFLLGCMTISSASKFSQRDRVCCLVLENNSVI